MTKPFNLKDFFKPIEMGKLDADPAQLARVRDIIDEAGSRMKPEFRESFARRLIHEKVTDPAEIVRRTNAHVVEYPATAMTPGDLTASPRDIAKLPPDQKLAWANRQLAAQREAKLKGER